MFGSKMKRKEDVDLEIKKARKNAPVRKIRKPRKPGRKVRPRQEKEDEGSRDIFFPDRSEKNWVMSSSVDRKECETEYVNFAESLSSLDQKSYTLPRKEEMYKLHEFKVIPHKEKVEEECDEGKNERLVEVKDIFRLVPSDFKFNQGYTSLKLYMNFLILGGMGPAHIAVYDISQFLTSSSSSDDDDEEEDDDNKGIKLVNVLKGPIEKASNQVVSICVINDQFMVTGEGSNGNLSIWKDWNSKYSLIGYYQVATASYSDRMTGKNRDSFSGVMDTCRLGNESSEFIAVVNRDGEDKRMIRIWNWKKGEVVQAIPIDTLNTCKLYYIGLASNLLVCYNQNEVIQFPLKQEIFESIDQLEGKEREKWLPFAFTTTYSLHDIENRKTHTVSYSRSIKEKYKPKVQTLISPEEVVKEEEEEEEGTTNSLYPLIALSTHQETEKQKILKIVLVDGKSVAESTEIKGSKLIKQTIFQESFDKGTSPMSKTINGLVSTEKKDGRLIIGSTLRSNEVVFILLK